MRAQKCADHGPWLSHATLPLAIHWLGLPKVTLDKRISRRNDAYEKYGDHDDAGVGLHDIWWTDAFLIALAALCLLNIGRSTDSHLADLVEVAAVNNVTAWHHEDNGLLIAEGKVDIVADGAMFAFNLLCSHLGHLT